VVSDLQGFKVSVMRSLPNDRVATSSRSS